MLAWFIVAAGAALWEVAARFQWVDAALLPPLSEVLAIFVDLAADASFREAARVTALEIAVAFVLVAPLGIGVGCLLGENATLGRVFNPVVHMILAIPQSIFLPLFILALGIGFVQKVVFGMSLGFFVIVSTTVAAVRSVPSPLVTAARAFGATRWQMATRIYLPAMLPLTLSGIRIGLVFTVTGVLLAEMYAAQTGLGRVILAWGESYELPRMLAAVLFVVGATVALNELLRWLERRVSHGPVAA